MRNEADFRQNCCKKLPKPVLRYLEPMRAPAWKCLDHRKVFAVLLACGAALQFRWLSRSINVIVTPPELLREDRPGHFSEIRSSGAHPDLPLPPRGLSPSYAQAAVIDASASATVRNGGANATDDATATAGPNDVISDADDAHNARMIMVPLGSTKRPTETKRDSKEAAAVTQVGVRGRGKTATRQTLIEKRAKRWSMERAAALEAAGEPPDPFPDRTVLGTFETEATKEEVRRHDRLVVEGMAYVASLSPEDLAEWDFPDIRPTTLCINVLASNRKIPYVDALIMMLMRGQSPHRLLNYAKINLLNIERRPAHMEYWHMRDRLSALPFVTVFNITEHYPAGPEVPFTTAQRYNTIAAFDLCIQSKLPFCLLLEDDAVTPMKFIDYFDQFVRAEMDKADFAGASVSLYSYHSHSHSEYQVDMMNEYHKPNGTYENEVSRTNAELRHLGKPAYVPSFQLVKSRMSLGTVANVFSLKMAKAFRDYLASFGDKDLAKFPDILMFGSRHFGGQPGVKRIQVEPSMVNHIGFYSEINKEKLVKASDVRFQLDAGELVPNVTAYYSV